MTRLTSFDVTHIDGCWNEYDDLMKGMLGLDLVALAAKANDRPPEEVRQGLNSRKLAAVSISSGDGVVGGFAEGLAAIGEHMGMTARVMARPDDEGFAEAEAWGAEVVIYADDDHFLARKIRTGEVADNNPATSRAFVAALELMAGGSLANRKVVVLGMGIIGLGAAERLLELGASPLLYDVNPAIRLTAVQLPGAVIINDQAGLAQALKRTNLIFDATPAALALDEKLWPSKPIVAAPGVPLAWPIGWLRPNSSEKLWHDPLQSGTAAMLGKLA